MEVCQCLMWTLLNIQTKNSLWLAQERSKSALCSHKSINSASKMASALRYQILIKIIATLHAYSTMIWTKKPQQLAKSKLTIGSNSASLWAHSRLSSLAGLLNWPLRTIWIAWSVLWLAEKSKMEEACREWSLFSSLINLSMLRHKLVKLHCWKNTERILHSFRHLKISDPSIKPSMKLMEALIRWHSRPDPYFWVPRRFPFPKEGLRKI